MTVPLGIAVAAAVLLLAAVLHYLFWTWRLWLPPSEDELLQTFTGDGWRIALGRCRPRIAARQPPVLLVHGIAMNRHAFEFGDGRHALAVHLARAGFDCFSIDLRGHGASGRALAAPGAPRGWNLDTYLREDIPAALETIRQATGSSQVLWVGHSQGAILGMAACGLYPERIAGLVALAGPAHFDVQERLRKLVLLRLGPLARLIRPAVRMVAPFAGLWHPSVAELAINARNMDPGVYRRLLANGIENLEPGVLAQFAAFIREDSFRSMDGAVDYRAALERCAQPALFVAAEKDGIAPPAVVQAAHRRWAGPKRMVVIDRDFGHTDLLLGRSAPEVVYPLVREFLLAHSVPAPLDETAWRRACDQR
jgi:pimeloyl-ACP methyl ester carboxylesterase